jgi:hypothetical protein
MVKMLHYTSIAPTYVSSGETWSGYLGHPEQYFIISTAYGHLESKTLQYNISKCAATQFM